MMSTVRTGQGVGAGGSRYICKDSRCKKLFTTLDLAKKHAIFSGHGVTVSRETEAPNVLDRDSCTDSDNGSVKIPDFRAFMKSQYQ